MKKSILIILVVFVCVAMTAPVAFGSASFTTTNSTVLGTVVFTPSTNVTLSAAANSGTGTPPNVYCAAAWHSASLNQGSGKEYAAVSDGGTANLTTSIVWAPLSGVLAGLLCTDPTAWPTGASWVQ